MLSRRESPRRHNNLLWFARLSVACLLLVLAGCTPPSTSPIAAIAIDSSSGEVPFVVQFDASESYDSGAHNLVDFQWDFGDGATGNGIVVTHTFASPGTYSVSLTVTNETPRTSTTQVQVTAVATAWAQTAYDGTASVTVGDYVQRLRAVSKEGAPIAGVNCRVVGDGRSAMALVYDPSGVYAPLLASLAIQSPVMSSRMHGASTGPRSSENELRLALWPWDTDAFASGFEISLTAECFSDGTMDYLAGSEFTLWKGLTLDALAADGSDALAELFEPGVSVVGALALSLSSSQACDSGLSYRCFLHGAVGEDAASARSGLEEMVGSIVARYRASGYSGTERFTLYRNKWDSAEERTILVLPHGAPQGNSSSGLRPSSAISAPAGVVLPTIEGETEQPVDFTYQVGVVGDATHFTAVIQPGGNTYSCPIQGAGSYSGSLRYVAPAAGASAEFEIRGQLSSTPGVEPNQDSETVHFTVAVRELETSDAPVIDAFTATPPVVAPGESAVISVEAHDPDGDALSYTWSATGGSLSETTGPAAKTWLAPEAEGTWSVSVSVSDGDAGHSPATSSVAVSVIHSNLDPSASITTWLVTPNPATAGQSVNFQAVFRNSGSSTYTFPIGLSVWKVGTSIDAAIINEWKTVTLNAGQEQTVTFTSTTFGSDRVGDWYYQFGVWKSDYTTLLDKKPSPAQILTVNPGATTVSGTITAWLVTPNPAYVGQQAVEFMCLVQNTGTSRYTFPVGLSVWKVGTPIGTALINLWAAVTLDPGESQLVTLPSHTFASSEVGSYYYQFGLWKDDYSTLLDKEPAPAEILNVLQ